MDCIFCEIAAGRVPAQVAYQDEQVMAFSDLNPQAPVHLLVIPRAHHANIQEIGTKDLGVVGKMVAVAQRLASERGLWPGGYRLVVNTGDDGGQTVHHLHMHLLGGRSMQWPPG